MKKGIVILLAAMFIFSFGACGKKDVKVIKEIVYDYTLEQIDESVAKDVIGPRNSEYTGYYALSLSEDAYDFTWNALTMDIDKDGNLIELSREAYGGLDKLEKNTAVYLAGECSEIIPNLGVSFKDVNGKEHLYTFMLSGEDGHPFLTEY